MVTKCLLQLIAADFTSGGLSAPINGTPEVASPSVRGTRVNIDNGQKVRCRHERLREGRP